MGDSTFAINCPSGGDILAAKRQWAETTNSRRIVRDDRGDSRCGATDAGRGRRGASRAGRKAPEQCPH